MPYASPEDKKKYSEDWYASRREAGLCINCDKPAVPLRSRCQKHLDRQTQNQTSLASARKSAGMCVYCGERPLETANHCSDCRVKANVHKSNHRIRLVSAVLDHYGRECVCCGEANKFFLTMDHVNGNGNAQRRENGWDSYVAIYRIFRTTGSWPEDFRVLCYNCNSGRWRNGGKCPHEEGKCLRVA
jgi:hypothetical protein